MRQTSHINLLDCARGVAILMVLGFHTLGHVYTTDELPWAGWHRGAPEYASFLAFMPLCYGREAGVALFFVISGFCIHLSFQRSGSGWREFFSRRFFRLYPAYLVALVAAAILLPVGIAIKNNMGLGDFLAALPPFLAEKEFLAKFITHVFLVHNFHPMMVGAIDGPCWSLAVEVQLYLIYPLLLFLARKLGWNRAMMVPAVCEILIRGFDAVIQPTDGAQTHVQYLSWLLSFSPFGFWFSWAIGAYMADAYLKGKPLPFLKAPMAVLLALGLASYFVRPLYSFSFLWFALLSAALLSRLLSGWRPAFTLPPGPLDMLRKIGLWSYSIYLFHQPLMQLLTPVVQGVIQVEDDIPPPVWMLVFISLWAVIIPIGTLSYRFLELPSIALGKRLAGKRKSVPIMEVPTISDTKTVTKVF